MIPLSNEELYKVLNKENETIEKFREANPQFKIDHANVASTLKEIEYFEHLYSHMGIGRFEFAPSDFNFKRTDTYTFQQIFSDNFYSFLENNPSLNIRPIVIEEVEKMLTCQDPDYGHAIYECPNCHETHIIPFTCKSRFCNTCAIKYQMDRALEITSKLIRCEHRHVVFTIPEQLRIFFIKDRHLLDILFKAVEECIKYIFKKRAPKKKYTPGVILVLHTFGRDLKFNPHIHCLITEGASSNIKNCPTDDIWINFTHFNYEAFRKSFQYSLLKYMKKYLKETLSPKEFTEFQQIVDFLYANYDNGFYVRAKPFEGKSNDGAVKYLLRYFNRPAMAQSRILYYDGTYVVFYYQRHEDDMYVVEKVHVYDLIKRLIIHIPEKNFKMLRYAGLYSSHKCAHFDKLIKKLSDIAIQTRKSLANWRVRIQMAFHYDPLICPSCHSTMTFSEIVIAKNSS